MNPQPRYVIVCAQKHHGRTMYPRKDSRGYTSDLKKAMTFHCEELAYVWCVYVPLGYPSSYGKERVEKIVKRKSQ